MANEAQQAASVLSLERATKALKRKMVPMDTSLPTLGTEKASVHPKLPVFQEFLSNDQLRVWLESRA